MEHIWRVLSSPVQCSRGYVTYCSNASTFVVTERASDNDNVTVWKKREEDWIMATLLCGRNEKKIG